MNEIIGFIKYTLKSKLLILGFLIYFLFNISALKTNWFDYFFFGSSIHYCCQGLDFYQIPNGAYSLFNGGELTGEVKTGIKRYSDPYVGNYNVYHPLLTIILGGFLIQLSPDYSIFTWDIIKIIITLLTVFYIYINFKDNKYLNLSFFIFLTNFSQYNEIKLSQFQFLFNISVLYLLINLVKNKSKLEGGILFFLTLIAKPISLLLLPVLILKKKFLIATIGICVFLISTLTFNILGIGGYYVENIKYHLLNPVATEGIDFMSLDALLRNTLNLSTETIRYLKFSILLIIYLLALGKKSNALAIIFILMVYFLLFYDLVFQYHFSILGPILSICLLALPSFQTKLARILILVINLPTVFFILRFLNIEFNFDSTYGNNPTITGWQIVSFFQLLPIIILSVIIFIKELPEGLIKRLSLIKND